MVFRSALDVVADFFAARGAQNDRWAVIGGVALVAYGLARTTIDLDFVVESAVQDDLIVFLERKGFATLHRSSGYSNHEGADAIDATLGRIDFVYVGRETADSLFAASRWLRGPGGREIRVPSPEHLAALKVQAMANDPARRASDLADVRFLLTLPGVDRKRVRRAFERRDLEELFDELG